jgi:hypothetical protein
VVHNDAIGSSLGDSDHHGALGRFSPTRHPRAGSRDAVGTAERRIAVSPTDAEHNRPAAFGLSSWRQALAHLHHACPGTFALRLYEVDTARVRWVGNIRIVARLITPTLLMGRYPFTSLSHTYRASLLQSYAPTQIGFR